MTSTRCKTRFAPSPTGYLHLGNVRTALFSALYARHRQGVFLLRIEDTDAERSQDIFYHALLEDLRWLGLDWQEGVEQSGGEHGPYRQSERDDVYETYYQQLHDAGRVYPCFCSEQQLKLSRKAQVSAGQPPRYAGTCAHLTSEQVQAKLAQGLQPTLRFRVPRGEQITFSDLARGPQVFKSDDIGDFIIRRADGSPAFFFCNAIDDSLMGVTHVLRGDDHIANTPRQLMILAALKLPMPEYGHISLIVGADGAPLSKRHGSASVRDLRNDGYLPLGVLNHLARLGHHYENTGFLSLDELAGQFELSRLGKAPARHDTEQLNHWQREAVARTDAETLWRWLGETTRAMVPLDQRTAFLETVRPNIVFPQDGERWAHVVYSDQVEFGEGCREVILESTPELFRALLAALDTHGTDFRAVAEMVKQATGVKGKALFQPLRAAITCELHGPEMGQVLPLITKERAKLRVEQCLNLLGNTHVKNS